MTAEQQIPYIMYATFIHVSSTACEGDLTSRSDICAIEWISQTIMNYLDDEVDPLISLQCIIAGWMHENRKERATSSHNAQKEKGLALRPLIRNNTHLM